VEPQDAPVPGSPLDIERGIVDSLYASARERAVAERTLAETQRTLRARNEQIHEAALRAISEATRAAVGEAHRRFMEELDALEARAAARAAKVEADDAAMRRKAEARGELLEERAQHRYDEAVWMAESVYEAAIPVIRKEAQARMDEVDARLHALDGVVAAAHRQVNRYRQRALPEPPPDTVPAEALTPVRERPDEALAQLTARLERLRQCRAAGLFRGPILFIPLAVLAAAGGVAGGIVGEDRGIPFGTGAAVGIAAGLAVQLLGTFALYGFARGEVRRAYVPFLEEAARLRAALGAARREADDERRRRERQAELSRDADLRRAEEEYGPAKSEIERRLQEIIVRLNERTPVYRERVATLRARELGAANAARDAAISAAEEREQALQEEERARHAAVLAALEEDARSAADAQRTAWRSMQERTLDGLRRLHALDAACAPDWSAPSWERWEPPSAALPGVRIGRLELSLDQVPEALPPGPALAWPEGTPGRWVLPAFLGAAGRMSLVVEAGPKVRDAGLAILQNALARILVSIPPGRARFTLFDPVGLGQSFAGFMHMADEMELLVNDRIWTDPKHIEQRLADLTDHMELVIQKHLRNEYPTIEEYNRQAGEIAEPLRFLVMADFPANVTEQAARRFASILQSGARCGVHVLLLRDARTALPPGLDGADLRRHAVTIAWREEGAAGGRWVLDEGSIARLPFQPDAPPGDAFLQRLTRIVGRAAAGTARVEVPFSGVAPRPEARWTLDSAQNLRIPIGRSGASRVQHLLLGEGTSQHALIAGKTGSGKSSLLNALIVNAALWYSPDELEFWLVDFKKGVEFKAYASHHLPHARAVAVESDREFGLSVLQGLDDELRRRGELFRAAGVQNLADWRALGRPERMPRSLLVIDEFQELFIEDDKVAQDAALLLDRLVRQGRAFGMHVVLGSQTLGGAYSLARSTMGQMGVRIALQCSETDSQLILSDDNTAARLLNRPGEAIYNDAGGLTEGNNPFQVVWLGEAERDRLLDEVAALDRDRQRGGTRPRPVVFEGNAPADPLANAPLLAALEERNPGRRAFAPLLWLGDAVSIKDPTAAVMVRRSGANLAIVGQRDEGACAAMAMAILSVAAQSPVAGTRLVVLDGTTPDDRLHGVLARVAGAVPHRVDLPSQRDAGDAILAVGEELARRTASGAGDAPGLFVLVNGLHRFRALRRAEDDFGYGGASDAPATPDRVLALLLKEGPLVGIHCVLWADTVANLQRSVDRNSLRELEWKALFQMSAADSSTLMDAPTASRLGFHRALLVNDESGLVEKFRPYSLPDAALLDLAARALRGRA
jgi:DNA segregation ATPase FtsK/SpoIIIE-like protein